MRYITSAYEWKVLSDSLKDILTECFFVFESTQITMNNVDPEKVVDVYYEIRPNPETYFCKTTFKFPVYIQTVYRVLRGVKPTDTMEMMDLMDGSLKLTVHSEFGTIKNQISLRRLQEEIPTYIRNQRDYEVGVTILNDQLYHILHDLAALSRQITIRAQDSAITFSAKDESGTMSSYSQSFNELDFRYRFSNTYLLKFIEKFTKPAMNRFVTLRMHKQLPLSVVYYLENGSLEMTIAGLE
jgi:hypothetical protein